MPLVLTKQPEEVFAPVTAAGAKRGASMQDAMVLTRELANGIDGAVAGQVVQTTWTGLAAIEGARAGQPATVLGPDAGIHTDPVVGGTVANVGEYVWSASPAGWRRVSSLQRAIVSAINTGEGTPDAIEAAANTQFSKVAGEALITVNFLAANSSAMTLSVDGETPRPVVTNTGAAIPSGYVQPDMAALVQIDADGNYRLFSYGDATAIQAAAEAAQAAAEEAAQDAVGAAAGLSNLAFASKMSAEDFTPLANTKFIGLTGSAFENSVGRVIPFEILPSETPDPTDLPAPAFVRLTDGSLARWQGREFELELGAKGDDLTDNSSFFEDLSNSMAAFDGVISAAKGIFRTDKSLVIPKNAKLIGQGSGRTIITGKGSIGTFASGAVLCQMGGDPVPLGVALGANVAVGARSLAFAAAHGLDEQQLLLLYNDADHSGSRWRRNYRAGEFCVPSLIIDSDELTLESAIRGDGEWAGVTGNVNPAIHIGTGGTFSPGYSMATMDVYICDDFGRGGGIEGVTAIAPGAGPNVAVAAIQMGHIYRPEVRDVRAINGGDASFVCKRLVSGRFDGVVAIQRNVSDTGYGLVFSSCQDMDAGRSYFEGYRHGVVTGGDNDWAVFNTGVVVHDFTAVNHVAAIASADWHGDTIHCAYRDGKLFGGGLNCAGNRNEARNIEWTCEDATGIGLLARELSGCDHKFLNIKGRTASALTTNALFDFGNNNTGALSDVTTLGGTLEFSGIDIVAPSNERSFISLRNQGFSAFPWRVVAKDIKYDAASANAGFSPALVRVDTVTGNPPESVDTARLTPLGSANLSRVSLTTSSKGVTKVKGLPGQRVNVTATSGSTTLYPSQEGPDYIFSGTLAGDLTATLDAASASTGDIARVERTGAGLFPLIIGGIYHRQGEWSEWLFNGTSWLHVQRGVKSSPSTDYSSDANLTFAAHSHGQLVLLSGAITATRSVSLSTAGAVNGDRVRFLFTGSGGTWNIGTGPLASLTTTKQYADFENQAGWKLVGYGTLP